MNVAENMGNGTIQTKHVKEFASNNKMITTLLVTIITVFGSGGVANYVSSGNTNINIGLLEYRLQEAEEALDEQEEEFEDLVEALHHHDIFASTWSIGFDYAEAPPEYSSNDSGSFNWARDKILTTECKFAVRESWIADSSSKKGKKAKKLNKDGPLSLYPRVIYNFEKLIPYIHYSAEKKKVYIPVHEDRVASDWQLFDCKVKDRSI